MKYSHTGIFIPKGKNQKNSDTDTRKATITTDNPIPSNQEQAELNVQLQKEINAYSARNYWELDSILTTYHNPPWRTITEIAKCLRDITHRHGRTRCSTKDVQFVSVQHETTFDKDDIKNKIEDEFDIPIDDRQLESETESVVRFYTTRRTKIQ